MADDELIHLIEEHHLLVRPTVLGRWTAGRFKGVTGDGKAYDEPETHAEAVTLAEAVRIAAAREQRWSDKHNWLNPETGEITWAKEQEEEEGEH